MCRYKTLPGLGDENVTIVECPCSGTALMKQNLTVIRDVNCQRVVLDGSENPCACCQETKKTLQQIKRRISAATDDGWVGADCSKANVIYLAIA